MKIQHIHKFVYFERYNTEVIRQCSCGYTENAFNIYEAENHKQYCANSRTNFNNPKIKWNKV